MLKKASSKAAASEEARRYGPHFVGPFALLNSSWQTEKPLTYSDLQGGFLSVEPLSNAWEEGASRRAGVGRVRRATFSAP